MPEIAIAAGVHKLKIFTIRYEPVLKHVIIQKNAMYRTLIIKSEIASLKTDLNDPAFKCSVLRIMKLRLWIGSPWLINRVQRICRENIFDVRYQQFLMLLFMVEAKIHKKSKRLPIRFIHRFDQLAHSA